MTYCRHCRRDRSLDERVPLHMLLLMFLVLMLVLLWGDGVRRASGRDCGEGSIHTVFTVCVYTMHTAR